MNHTGGGGGGAGPAGGCSQRLLHVLLWRENIFRKTVKIFWSIGVFTQSPSCNRRRLNTLQKLKLEKYRMPRHLAGHLHTCRQAPVCDHVVRVIEQNFLIMTNAVERRNWNVSWNKPQTAQRWNSVTKTVIIQLDRCVIVSFLQRDATQHVEIGHSVAIKCPLATRPGWVGAVSTLIERCFE